MIRGLIYSIAEGLKGLNRAKFSASISVITIFLSLIIIAIFLIFIFNVHLVATQIQARMELEVFIDNSFTEEQIAELSDNIKSIEGIERIGYVSRERAAEIFREHFGEEMFEILEENPLPRSFHIKLKPSFLSSNKSQQILNEIVKLDGVDEILYRHDLLVMLEKYMNLFIIIMMMIGFLLALGSIILVSNTIKLIIFSRQNIIEIMKLVGAKKSFIRRPFLVEGLIQGITGGVLAVLFLYGLIKVIKLELTEIILIDERIYYILLILGTFFGLIGSIIALRKFLRYY